MKHGFRDIKKILVIKLRHIGDVLLAVPVFRALRESFPDAHISALVNSGTEEVLIGNPLIDEIIVFDRNIKRMGAVHKYLKELSFLKTVWKKKFDMAVDLTSGDRAAILSLASGARYRLAYDPGGDGFPGKRRIYTHRAHKDGSRHMVVQNLDIVRQFGITTENLAVDLFIPEDARSFAEETFKQNNISAQDTVVHIHPTSRWLFKCWKDEYMAEVMAWLAERGIKVVLTSSPDKREMDKAKNILSLYSSFITRHSSPALDLSGKTTIKQLAAVTAASDLFLGVDSAPMHIAAAVGTPVVALFGPTGHVQWGPWGKGHLVFTKNMSCGSCASGLCDNRQVRKCLELITKEEVIAALERILGAKKSSM